MVAFLWFQIFHMFSLHCWPPLHGISLARPDHRTARGNRMRPLPCCVPAMATWLTRPVRDFCAYSGMKRVSCAILTLKNLTAICCHFSSVYPTNHCLPSGRESLRRRNGSNDGICKRIDERYKMKNIPWLQLPWGGALLRPSHSLRARSKKRNPEMHISLIDVRSIWLEWWVWRGCQDCDSRFHHQCRAPICSYRVSPRFRVLTWKRVSDNRLHKIMVENNKNSNTVRRIIPDLSSFSKSVQVIAVPRMRSDITSRLILWNWASEPEKLK